MQKFEGLYNDVYYYSEYKKIITLNEGHVFQLIIDQLPPDYIEKHCKSTSEIQQMANYILKEGQYSDSKPIDNIRDFEKIQSGHSICKITYINSNEDRNGYKIKDGIHITYYDCYRPIEFIFKIKHISTITEQAIIQVDKICVPSSSIDQNGIQWWYWSVNVHDDLLDGKNVECIKTIDIITQTKQFMNCQFLVSNNMLNVYSRTHNDSL